MAAALGAKLSIIGEFACRPGSPREAKAPSIIARLRRDLLSECYRPGDDVRRVWLPKPGGGQRGLGIMMFTLPEEGVVNRMTWR